MIERSATLAGDPARPLRLGPGEGLVLFAVALLMRVAFAWLATGPHATPYSDPAEYDAVAWNLARGVGFSLNAAAGPYPSALSPPLLPFVVSLLYRVVGHSYFAAVLLQCAIGALIPVLLAAFGASLFGRTAGRVAGWLAAVHPLLVAMCANLLTETLFAATMLLAIALTARWVMAPGRTSAFGAGIAWGVANLARPMVLPLPLALFAWAWRPLRGAATRAERVRQMALLLLGMALVIAPWTLRNAIVLHAFVPVSSRGGGALLVSNNWHAWYDPVKRGGASNEVWESMVANEFKGISEQQAQALAQRRAMEFLRAHLSDWPGVAVARLQRFWRLSAEGGGTGAWVRPGSPFAPLLSRLDPLFLWSAVMFPLALWGLVRSLRAPPRWIRSLGLWVIGYFCLLAVAFFGTLRMRMPVEPLLLLYAAVGIEDLRRRVRGGQAPPAAEIAALG
jgi:4-amino-4-deoxy-L-arabinose transferase-like glycosyltransferase